VTTDALATTAELRGVYGWARADSPAALCVKPRLDKHHRAWIAHSPFIVIASVGEDGQPDVSPRGDLPGFVTVLDDQTLIIPDRPGNKKLITLSNVLAHPDVALLFFVPGRVESMRLTGKASITTDPELLAPLAVAGRAPLSGLLIAVEAAWLHCGKALVRSCLWDPSAQVAPDALPSLGTMLADQIEGLEAEKADERLEFSKRERLWGEAG
jgi:uncharacterized protein